MIVKMNTVHVVVTKDSLEDSSVDVVVCPVDADWNPLLRGQQLPHTGPANIQISKKTEKIIMVCSPEDTPCFSIMYANLPSLRGTKKSSDITNDVLECITVADQYKFSSLSFPVWITDVLSAEDCVNSLLEAIRGLRSDTCLKEIYIYANGMKEEQIVKKTLQENCKTSPHSSITDFSILYEGNKKNRCSFLMPQVYTGSMKTVEVDVIVNTTSLRLELDKGYVSSSILQAAGQGIQAECFQNKPTDFNFGDIVTTSAGNMKTCKHICHGALPSWDPTANFSLMILRRFMVMCLEFADKVKGTSIAFPALGTGNLGYPRKSVAKMMLDTVVNYGRRKRGKTTIKTVIIVVFDKDKETKEAMKDVLTNRDEEAFSKSALTAIGLEGRMHIPASLSSNAKLPSCSLKFQIIPHILYQKVDVRVYFDDENGIFKDERKMNEFKKNGILRLVSTKNGHQCVEFYILRNNVSSPIKQQIERMLALTRKHRFRSIQVHVKEQEVKDITILVTEAISNNHKESAADGWYLSQVQIVIMDKQEISCKPLMEELDKSSMRWRQKLIGLQDAVRMTVSAETSRINEIVKNIKSLPPVLLQHKNSYASGASSSPWILSLPSLLEKPLLQASVNTNPASIKKSSFIADKITTLEENYLAMEYFCQGERFLKKVKNIKYEKGEAVIQLADKNVRAEIEGKLTRFASMNKCEVPLTQGEQTKVESAIKDVIDNVKGVFCYQPVRDAGKQLWIMCDEYTGVQQAKYRISLSLGRIRQTETRRGRNFVTQPQKPIEIDYVGEKDQDTGPSSYQLQTLNQNAVELTTAEGLDVKIYVGSILHLDVDCIVNAANENLLHGGGVAYAISKAAGYQFDKESRDFIRQNGPLQVGECCKTSAGNLQYKGVLHAVGPRWRPKDQINCLRELKDAVVNSMMECDFQGYRSVAIPAISSGIFGVPKELCTQEYCRAVEEYSKQRKLNCSLREVHFVDKDEGMVFLIQQTFINSLGMTVPSQQKKFQNGFGSKTETNNSATSSFSRNQSLSQETSNVSSSFSGNDLDFNDFFQFENMGIDILNEDVISVEAEAIVSPENISGSCQSKITKDIRDKSGVSLQSLRNSVLKKEQNFTIGQVFPARTDRGQWNYVLLTIVPVWNNSNVDRFRQDVKNTYLNVFQKMEDLNIQDVAVPVIGADTRNVPVSFLAEGLYLACKEYSSVSKPVYLKMIIASQDLNLVGGVCKMMNDLVDGKIAIDNFAIGEIHGSTSVRNTPGTEETCCICMDDITDPKQLRCGHVFCKECIDQYFQYKPMCPNCGAVYGKIIGDQPEGTMQISTSHFDHLPGYERDGVITVTYYFPPGIQGEIHPNPGTPYESIQRSGYLPNNKRGKLISKLLKIAFDRKLVFTIGSSRTTGKEGVVTWNDIHHKTRKGGGPQRFGYPDPTYLDRVMEELAVKGVTEESLKDP